MLELKISSNFQSQKPNKKTNYHQLTFGPFRQDRGNQLLPYFRRIFRNELVWLEHSSNFDHCNLDL